MALPEISAWRVEVLRFTFFYSEPQSGRGRDWWKALTGIDPETTVNKQQTGEYVESGPYLQGQLDLKVAFNRLDWTLTYPLASMPDYVPPMDLQTSLDTMYDAFKKITLDPNVIRVAFGAVLLMPVENAHKGNIIFNEYMPFVKVDLDNVEDLFLQVNFPYVARSYDGMKINNVAKWSVMSGQFMQMAIGGFPQISTNFLVRGEVDLSSAGERQTPLDGESVIPLLDEFVAKTYSIFQEGFKS
ncbi:hypothetical protein EC919_104158 [Pseudomonas graminis]|jgi:hypothetical protein|uniref:hypothetical protein n=1 Tax=Pseudomonas graminis TaxID=158627 RepID=UPI001061C719|nr:hypothetical protein [Pseudomonas graminis]TDV54422.1 hypothetical protein EC919_104158 [Pseudomonas graminis]